MHYSIMMENAEETKKFGSQLGAHVKPNMLITLSGDLGAGKTTLTQGIAKGLNITRTVSSPTFTIMKIYQGRFPLYHIDAYRLEGMHQDLGFEEMIDGDGLTVIEWPDYIQDMLQDERLSITIKRIDEDRRQFEIDAVGTLYETLMEEVR